MTEAAVLYREAADLRPDAVIPLYRMGLVKHRLGQIPSAISVFRQAEKLDPNDPTIPNNLGSLFFQKNKIAQAEKAFQRALELNPDYPEAYENLGRVYLASERLVEAKYMLTMSLRLDPARQGVQEALEACRTDEAAEKIRRTYRRVLIVMEEGIGNMVMLTPTLRALKEAHPGCDITVLGRQPSVQIIQGWDAVDEVIEKPGDGMYDLCILTLWSSRFRSRHRGWIRKHCAGTLLLRLAAGEHEADSYFQVARLFGYSMERPGTHCQTRESEIELPAGRPVVALSDTTLANGAWERKRWPYYPELARRLTASGYAVVLVGGEAEAGRFRPGEWPGGVIDCQNRTGLQETAALLSRCEAFIGNDSGPAHMAAATGIRTFVFFGPTLVSKNQPLGKQVTVFRANLDCIPCQYSDRWETCRDWRCMKALTVDKVMPIILDKLKEKDRVRIAPGRASDLRLVAKDYSDCRLIDRDNRLMIERDGQSEPLRVHLVGAQRANAPWGMENELLRAMEAMGIETIDTDYRKDDDFIGRFMREAHLMLVCKGSGIPPDLISRYPGRTALWYPDDVFTTVHAPRDLKFNGRAFDRVYSFDQAAVEAYRKLGIRDVRYLPLAMSPALHRRMEEAVIHDVSFVGNIHPNRKPFFERLQRRFDVFVTKAFMDDMVRIYNASKIVLNLGIGPTGIQQRVFEALGCGAFLITNEIPVHQRLFEDRKHLVYFNDRNIEDLIAYYLENETERQTIAEAGYMEALARHTFEHRLETLLSDTGFTIERPFTAIPQIRPQESANPVAGRPRRRLLVFWHGIGDNVMATPALRAYRLAHPDDHIGFMYLRRIHKDGLMEGCPYVDGLHVCSDAWDDYPDYETGVKAVVGEARAVASDQGYDEVVPVTMRAMPLTHHRIDRIAFELGVTLDSTDTELWISKSDREAVDEIWEKWGIRDDDFVVALHRRGANIHKYWEVDEAQKVVDELTTRHGAKVIAFETHTDLNREPAKQLNGVFSTADLEALPLKVSAAIIDRCGLFIGLDSGPMWMATTTKTPIVALFTMTWMHQSAPLRENSLVVASQRAWDMATEAFKQTHSGRIIRDPSGGETIRADTVLEAVGRLLERKGEGDGRHEGSFHYRPPQAFHQNEAYWGAFLTLKCTADCPFCIQKIVPEEFKRMRNRELLSGEQWVSLLNGIEHRPGQPLALIGGEPSLHPDFIHILNHLEGYTITVTTNLISKHFKDTDGFVEKLNPKSPIRFNTSFHPPFIEAEEYIRRVKKLKASGLWVDQVAMVDHPGGGFKKYRSTFEKAGMALRAQSFLGYYDGVLYPTPDDPSVTNDPREHGITDMELYREGFGARHRKPILCRTRRFLIGPDGKVYNCHYHLYSDKAPIGDLREGRITLDEGFCHCDDFGFCNPCDFPHVRFKPAEKSPDAPKDSRPLPLSVERDAAFIRILFEPAHSLVIGEGWEAQVTSKILGCLFEDHWGARLPYGDGSFDLVVAARPVESQEAVEELERLSSQFLLIPSREAKSSPIWDAAGRLSRNGILIHRWDLEKIGEQSLEHALPFSIYEKVSCPICRRQMSGPVVKDMLHCDPCGLFRKERIQAPGALKEMLKETVIGALLCEEKRSARMEEAKQQVDWIMSHVPGPGKLFDVGASGGFMMKAAKDSGWAVQGNEISQRSIAWAKKEFGFDLEYGLLESLVPESDAYDLVILWHSLEHAFDLNRTLSKIESMLKDGGCVAIAVPIKESPQEVEASYETLHHYEFSADALGELMHKSGFHELDSRILDGEPGLRQFQAVYRLGDAAPDRISDDRPCAGTHRLLVTGPGHSGTNWATEIIRATGKYRFTEQVEDREFFEHQALPDGYATKLATDNLGLYWENLRSRMEAYPDMLVVFTMRHPLDNAISKMMRALPVKGNEPYRFIWEYAWDGTLNGSVKSLEFAFQIYENLKREYGDRVLAVRLEDLILHTEETTRKICEFVRAPFREAYIEAYQNTKNKWQKIRYKKGKDGSQIDMYKRWRTIHDGFFKDRKSVIEFLASRLKSVIEGMGYEPVSL